MCCCLIAIALIIAGKLVAIALIWALKRRAKEAQDDPEEGKFHFESLPEVFDFEGRSPCSRLTARHAYLLRLSYGDRGRGFYIPRAIISISFLDSAQPEPVGRATLGPDLLTANHRSYHNTAHPRFSQKPFLLFGKRETRVCFCVYKHNKQTFNLLFSSTPKEADAAGARRSGASEPQRAPLHHLHQQPLSGAASRPGGLWRPHSPGDSLSAGRSSAAAPGLSPSAGAQSQSQQSSYFSPLWRSPHWPSARAKRRGDGHHRRSRHQLPLLPDDLVYLRKVECRVSIALRWTSLWGADFQGAGT